MDCDDSDPYVPGSAELDSETQCLKDSDEDGYGDSTVTTELKVVVIVTMKTIPVYPNAEDLWYDGIDSDCAGNDDFDQDGDGYIQNAYSSLSPLTTGDCDDEDANIYPLAPDNSDGIDSDCLGNDDYDQDGDGDAIEELGGDCNDLDPAISSLAGEIWYDGVDQNSRWMERLGLRL